MWGVTGVEEMDVTLCRRFQDGKEGRILRFVDYDCVNIISYTCKGVGCKSLYSTALTTMT